MLPASLRFAEMREECVEFSRPFERVEIVATADMDVTDPDLRHGAASARPFTQIGTHICAAGNINLFERCTLSAQQIFRHVAVAAVAGSVDLDFGHDQKSRPRRPSGDALRNVTIIKRCARLAAEK
jgi:hypothetical protein